MTIKTIEANILNIKLYIHDYIYVNNVKEKINPIVIKNYIGLSFEEIEEKYGYNEAMAVYFSIRNGKFDPTKPYKIECEPYKEVELFDIEIIKNKKEYPYKGIIYLYPNIFSRAKNRKEIFSFTFSKENITNKQIIQRTVDVLNNNYV
jgi:hypothetical protein